jgi:hypothetical protein
MAKGIILRYEISDTMIFEELKSSRTKIIIKKATFIFHTVV